MLSAVVEYKSCQGQLRQWILSLYSQWACKKIRISYFSSGTDNYLRLNSSDERKKVTFSRILLKFGVQLTVGKIQIQDFRKIEKCQQSDLAFVNYISDVI